MAELRRRQAAGELSPEELAELRRLEAKAGGGDGGYDDDDGYGGGYGGGGGVSDAEAARMAELRRRQAAGELSPEELAELRRLEAKAEDGGGGGGGGGGGLNAAEAAELDAAQARIAELKRRQAAGELTPEELAELQALEKKVRRVPRSACGNASECLWECLGVPVLTS